MGNDTSVSGGHRKTALAAALVAVAVCFAVWWPVQGWYAGRLMHVERSTARDRLHLKVDTLSTAVNQRFALLDALVAFATVRNGRAERIAAEFPPFAAALVGAFPHIRNLILAPDGVNTYVYPVQGNEAALGHDQAEDLRPEARGDYHEALLTGETVITGPYELRQGGLGVVARHAVFLDEGYWGMASMVLDLPPLINQARLTQPGDPLDYALTCCGETLFWGDPGVFSHQPVVEPIELPQGRWELACAPRLGWRGLIAADMAVFNGVWLVFSALVAGMVYLLAGRQKRLAAAVRRRTSQLQTVQNERDRFFNLSLDMLCVSGFDGYFKDLNPAWERCLGRSREELLSKPWDVFVHPDDRAATREAMDRLLDGEIVSECVNRYRCEDGSWRWLSWTSQPDPSRGLMYGVARDVSNEIEARERLSQANEELAQLNEEFTAANEELVATNEELTEEIKRRAELEEELQRSRQRIYQVLESTSDAFFEADHDFNVRYINTKAERILERTPGSLKGKNLWEEFPLAVDSAFYREYHRAVDTGGSVEFEEYYPPLDTWFEVKAYAGDGTLSVYFNDITARKRMEEQLRRSLTEKEVLIKEIHHRVKNNLQVIVSLLGLQIDSIRDPHDRDLFRESQNRISSMAMVHEELYRSESLAAIEMRSYVEKLAHRLDSIFGRKSVDIEVHVDDIRLPVDRAVPCGLILNELVTNALVHAFENDDEGTVYVELARHGQEIELSVADDGRGLPDHLDPEQADSLGLRLVVSLADQLGAGITWQRGPGAKCTLRFKASTKDLT